ncbi:hypothetical protein T492DRAFT_75038 [Pavlovales sp. CCMP2436]|nr:hypothetical protein T492DRAFT_75038 [Pavlovales sp. CCMP2436]
MVRCTPHRWSALLAALSVAGGHALGSMHQSTLRLARLPRAGTRACATPAAVQSGERAEAAEAEISSLLELARASSASALRVPMSPSFTSPISLPSRFSVLRAERVRDARVSADIVTALVATGISSLTPVQREVPPLIRYPMNCLSLAVARIRPSPDSK